MRSETARKRPYYDTVGKHLIDNAKLPDAGPEPIDPAVLQDDDGQTYLYFGCRKPEVVKLSPSLIELAGSLHTVSRLDSVRQTGSAGRARPKSRPARRLWGSAVRFQTRRKILLCLFKWLGADIHAGLCHRRSSDVGDFTYAGKVMEHAASVTQHS